MKNPDLMYYRVTIGQILADAGINRDTIKEMAKASIDEKVEKQMGNILQQKLSGIESGFAFRDAVRDAVKKEVARATDKIDVNISLPLCCCTDAELLREIKKRDLIT